MKRVLAFFGALFLASAIEAQAAAYKVDKDHSSVSFKIKHLFSNVQGHFKDFEGTFEYDPGKPEAWSARGTIQAASIDTNVEARDKHLRGADFFDVEKHPTIEFKTTKIASAAEGRAKAEGLLTLHGTTKINRKDFGLGWNQTLETGGVLVGEEVTITLEIEGLLQGEALN
jgi:polyisoprenoid-binding protein YceI